MVGERHANLRVELGDQLGGALGFRIVGLRRARRHPGVLRIGVGEAGIEPGAAQHDEHAVLALVPEEHLDARNVHCPLELVHHRLCLGIRNAGPPGDR